MKSIVTLIVLFLTVQSAIGQACGVYRIQYVGQVNAINIKEIKLPTTQFLHKLERSDSELAFMTFKPENMEVNLGLRSHLTSRLYQKAEELKRFYKSKRTSMPIIIVIEENGRNIEIVKQLNWENIEMKIIDDDGFGKLFELNLKEVSLE